MNCETCHTKLKSNAIVRGYKLCYNCNAKAEHGTDFAKNNVIRLQQTNVNRHIRNSWRKKRTCEMGYCECDYCNGDC